MQSKKTIHMHWVENLGGEGHHGDRAKKPQLFQIPTVTLRIPTAALQPATARVMTARKYHLGPFWGLLRH